MSCVDDQMPPSLPLSHYRLSTDSVWGAKHGGKIFVSAPCGEEGWKSRERVVVKGPKILGCAVTAVSTRPQGMVSSTDPGAAVLLPLKFHY